jgi:hypothetical protein
MASISVDGEEIDSKNHAAIAEYAVHLLVCRYTATGFVH